MSDQPLTPEQTEFLAGLALSTSDELETSGASVTNRAFNLGCFMGLLPAGMFVVLIYLLSRGSLVGAAISCVLMLMGLVLFANLAASIARYNTNRLAYQEHVQADIEKALDSQGLSRAQFDSIALETLPRQAALRAFITPPVPTGETLTDRLIRRIKSL